MSVQLQFPNGQTRQSSGAQLSSRMEETYIKYRGMLKEFDVLSITQNPEEEPFKHKYAARKLMVCAELSSGLNSSL